MMKIFVLFLFFLLISSIDQRRHESDDEENPIDFKLSDLLLHNPSHERDRHKEYMPEEAEEDEDNDLPASFQREKKYPSRKKVLDEQQPDYPTEQLSHRHHKTNRSNTNPSSLTTTTIVPRDYLAEASLCINEYDIKSEQLVKVKDLQNGAHMIRFVMIGESSSTHGLNTKDVCMLHCCVEKNCDLAMLSEQRSSEGYKCYLFACNGSCTFATHRDYLTMALKKDLSSSSPASKDKASDATSSTLSYGGDAAIYSSHSTSFLRESSVILVLLIGILFTMSLLVLVGFYCRDSWKRGRTFKNRSTDADYLINGLYL